MFFAAALLSLAPVFFLALAAHAQTGPFVIQNTATGFVFEDHNPVSGKLGNPIVGARYNVSRKVQQSWTFVPAGNNGTWTLRNERRVGSQPIFAHADGLPGKELTVQQYGTPISLGLPFGFGVNAVFFANESPRLAITAPKVVNGNITLQAYNPTDLYQHWVFFYPNATTVSGTGPLGQPAVKLVMETVKGSPKL